MTPALLIPLTKRRTALMLTLIALGGAPLFAHDMWIEPATFSPEIGQIVALKLRVGQDLLGDPLALDPALVSQFIVEDSTGRRPVVERAGFDPAGLTRVMTSGTIVVGYRSNPSSVDLTAEKFNQYLKEEGLDAIAAARAKQNRTNAGARDLFARCAKTVILSGAPKEGEGDRPLGFTLELVAERNPYALREGQELPVRLTYEKRPLAGALVTAMNRRNPAERLTARTDNDGRVRFPLRPGGMWLIKAVHMIPAPAGSNADWASYWASLTFALPTPGMATN